MSCTTNPVAVPSRATNTPKKADLYHSKSETSYSVIVHQATDIQASNVFRNEFLQGDERQNNKVSSGSRSIMNSVDNNIKKIVDRETMFRFNECNHWFIK